MGHYHPNVRDLEFCLFELFPTTPWSSPPFAAFDPQVSQAVLEQVADLATGPVAASYVDGDRNPPTFDRETGEVTVNPNIARSFHVLRDAGFWNLDVPVSAGGEGAPALLRWAVSELILGANPAVWMYLAGPGFAGLVHRLGTPEQQRWAQLMLDRNWGATMVLTEPEAGSDVGAGRTKAVDNGDGTWSITGVKRFITGGDHDLAENIMHLVLARPEGAGPGTKGLSLFLVPKFLFDSESGELGARNGVYATGMEHKMGLTASATCEMTFGEKDPALGFLLGDVHDGIAQMFTVIEHARMMVGTKAVAQMSAGYQAAVEYAIQRLQGPDLTQAMDKTAPRVPILQHPDVRRALMESKAYTEGLRALVMYAAWWQDMRDMAAARGDAPALDRSARIADLLLPLVKGAASERAFTSLSSSLQVYGGSGFVKDFPLEQYVRDCRIDTLYEGTTAIQGLDLFFRKLVKDEFSSLSVIAMDLAADVEAHRKGPRGRLWQQLADTAEQVQTLVMQMASWALESLKDPRQVYRVGLTSTALLLALADVLVGWLLLRSAEVAADRLAGEQPPAGDVGFYQGKVAAADWFATYRLPLVAAEAKVACRTTDEVMDLTPDCW